MCDVPAASLSHGNYCGPLSHWASALINKLWELSGYDHVVVVGIIQVLVSGRLEAGVHVHIHHAQYISIVHVLLIAIQ